MTGYTHRTWRDEAQGMRDQIQKTLGGALEHMHAGLQAVGAGRRQTAQSNRWITGNNDLVTEGARVLEAHDPRLTRVSEAQARAGGVTEVAQRKRYNQL